METTATTRDIHMRPNAARWMVRVLGVVFIILGIIGLVGAEYVLGVFRTNIAHNVVHLLAGLILLGAGFATEAAARSACWVFAVIFALLMLLGFLGVAWFVDAFNVNMAANWLHLLMAVLLVAGGIGSIAQQRTHRPAMAGGRSEYHQSPPE